jgi:hypothetical protein
VSGSNVTDASDSHSEKQYPQITSTDEWMWIDVKPLSKKLQEANRYIVVSMSNVTDASDLPLEKQDSQINSTDEGM